MMNDEPKEKKKFTGNSRSKVCEGTGLIGFADAS